MNRIATALLLCLAYLAGSGQLASAPLWELEGTRNRVRLLGSIHFLRPGDYPLPMRATVRVIGEERGRVADLWNVSARTQ